MKSVRQRNEAHDDGMRSFRLDLFLLHKTSFLQRSVKYYERLNNLQILSLGGEMKLFLIRHGETEHNVKGVYAGVTDSSLTNHGVLQTKRLGQHFVDRKVKIAHVFSSDLQRAFKTAEAVRLAQPESDFLPLEVKKVLELREQDFGFYEGKAFYARTKESNKTGKETHQDTHRTEPGFVDVESKDSMKIRSDRFVDEHLIPVLDFTEAHHSIVVVAHGIILAHLWRCILRRFPAQNVTIAPGAVAGDREFSLEYLGGFSNTGYLELDIHPRATPAPAKIMSPVKKKRDDEPDHVHLPKHIDNETADILPEPPSPAIESEEAASKKPIKMLTDMTLSVIAVNCLVHLEGLKKTRGGIGSLKHDESQKTMDSFFKKRKTS